MELRGSLIMLLFLSSFIICLQQHLALSANLVFDVKHKFGGARNRGGLLKHLRAHDARRHARLLLSSSSSSSTAVHLTLGGNGLSTEAGLYFAKIGLGTPSRDYYVQVDTGSDILWVNCAGCTECPTKSDLGFPLKLFNPSTSSTANIVSCDQKFCEATYNGQLSGCKPDVSCQYNVAYGDGSSTAGYFVEDLIQLNHVSGNFQTSLTNGSVAFGCGAKQSGSLGTTSGATDGILGFGQSTSSVISQLAAAGKVKKVFSHCLDTLNGGGIFTIGQVVQPKVNTTPLVPNHVNDDFPDVTFHFADSLTLKTYPHDYLFQTGTDVWCLGWMNGGFQTEDGTHTIILGDLVLSNRLVVYDLEKQTIGWTEYNCSSSIKVKDDQTGGTYSVGATNLNAASRPTGGCMSMVLLLLIAMLHTFST